MLHHRHATNLCREEECGPTGQLDACYRTTKSIRIRMRAQMILLSAERPLVPHQIASIVRKDEQTVRRWLRRYQAEGVAG